MRQTLCDICDKPMASGTKYKKLLIETHQTPKNNTSQGAVRAIHRNPRRLNQPCIDICPDCATRLGATIAGMLRTLRKKMLKKRRVHAQ